MLLPLQTIFTWGRPESTGSVNDMLACQVASVHLWSIRSKHSWRRFLRHGSL